ncbi:MAG: L,D-transpeptidase family protein [Phycisphaerales bacterium]
MALASQSSRMDRHSSSSKGRGLPTLFIVTIASGAALAGAYWLVSGDGDTLSELTMPRSASAAEGGAGASMESGLAGGGSTMTATLAASDVRDTRRSALDEAIALAGTPAESARPSATDAATDAAADDAARAQATTEPAQSAVNTAISTDPDAARAGAAQDAPKPEAPKQDAPKQDAPRQESPTTPPTFNNNNNSGASGTDAAEQSAPAKPAPAAGSPEARLAEGLALGASEPVKARLLLSQALLSGALNELDARNASTALAKLSAQLFLTPVYNANDPSCMQYTVQPNDSLEKIVRKNKIGCDWRLVARMNNIKKPEAIQVGKRLKLPRGPFSAVVSKRDYRIDICMGEGDARIVVASMPVGLGAANGTPLGRFKVRPGSKLLNPEWIHPVTGQRFEADDAANPIGEHWLGLEGLDEANSKLAGYGIHGTIEPDSIGQDHSLGCVRLLAGDVALVWESLADGAPVEIRAK